MNIIQGVFTPIIDDEAYYWLWSTKLSFGYFDHPPMVALWIYLSDLLFDHEIGARFFTIVLNTIAAFLYWKTANPKTKNERTIFSLTYFSLIFVQIFSFVSTPDSPLLFFTIAYLFVLKNYINKQSILSTVLLGVCFAGLMYSKYHGVLVLASTLVPILFFIIKKPTFYFAVLISLGLYTPHFIWLYENDFPPISYHFVDRSAEQNFSITQPIIYVLTAIFGAAGLLFIYIANALKQVNRSDLFKKSVFWLVVGPFLFFLISTIKDTTQAQWLLISYIGLGLILYWYFIQLEKNKWVKILGFSTVGLIGLARILIMIPSVSPFYETKVFGEFAGDLTDTEIVAFEKYQEASIFQFYNQERKGVVYRTLGNRNSQFTLWGSENLLNQPFTYITPWMESTVSFEGLKKKKYFINPIENYKPIHRTEALFLDLNQEGIEINKDEVFHFRIQLNDIDMNLLKQNKVNLSLFITKDQQHNIVEEIKIPIDKWVNTYEIKNGFLFNFDYQTTLDSGDYKAYIGLSPVGLIAKYQSKPLKITVTE